MRWWPLLVIAAFGTSAPAAAQEDAHDVAASVRPADGSRATTFRVSFTARRDTGIRGLSESGYVVDAVRKGGGRAGCGSARSAPAGEVAAGQKVTVRLRAPRGGWCPGRYVGQVTYSSGPYCPPDKTQPCPSFPSTSRTVGRFSFRVARR